MNVMWSETMHQGGKWSGNVGRGKLIRLTQPLDAAAPALMGLLLLEQVYRAVKINRGEPYHK